MCKPLFKITGATTTHNNSNLIFIYGSIKSGEFFTGFIHCDNDNFTFYSLDDGIYTTNHAAIKQTLQTYISGRITVLICSAVLYDEYLRRI